VTNQPEAGRKDVNHIIVVRFDKPKLHVPGLRAVGIPADQLVTLDRPSQRSHGERSAHVGAG